MEAARRLLVQAQHDLLCPTVEGLAGALLSTSIALLHLAKADRGQRSLALLVPVLSEARLRVSSESPAARSPQPAAHPQPEKNPPSPSKQAVSAMEKKATKEERHELKKRVIDAVTAREVPALDVGEVLVSIGAAMLKGSNQTESEFLQYCKRVWAAQQSSGAPAGN